MAEEIKPLPERRNVGRALSYDEKVKLLKTAASKPEWQVARLAMALALNTTMRACEIQGLCWRDVDFIERTLTVRRSKTEAGERVILLNVDAWAAMLELWERAKTFGGTQPQHYVFASVSSQGPLTGKSIAGTITIEKSCRYITHLDDNAGLRYSVQKSGAKRNAPFGF